MGQEAGNAERGRTIILSGCQDVRCQSTSIPTASEAGSEDPAQGSQSIPNRGGRAKHPEQGWQGSNGSRTGIAKHPEQGWQMDPAQGCGRDPEQGSASTSGRDPSRGQCQKQRCSEYHNTAWAQVIPVERSIVRGWRRFVVMTRLWTTLL